MSGLYKYLRSIVVAIITITTILSTTAQQHYILHVDLNKTILADDPAGGKSTDDVLNQLLAEEYCDCWDTSIKNPISYSDYVTKHLFPGEKSDKKLKNLRNQKLFNFTQYLHSINHPAAPMLQKRFELLSTKIKQSGNSVFSSFYKLIQFLKENNYKYSIILRTFGDDIDRVLTELENKLEPSFFAWHGQFNNGTLEVLSLTSDEKLVLNTTTDIYNFFIAAGNCAIRDDWKTWNSYGEIAEYGKLLPIDETNTTIIPIFFDDNAKDGIINARNLKNNSFIPTTDLIEQGTICVVDTLAAIQNDQYFIDILKQVIL